MDTSSAENLNTDGEETTPAGSSGGAQVLNEITLAIPYIPDFLPADVRYWFVPSRAEPREVYHEVIGQAAENCARYYSKKGWNFLHRTGGPSGDGPFRVADGGTRFDIIDAGRFFAAKPLVYLAEHSDGIPLVSLEKREPLNPWKPNYIRAVDFIKRYEWPHAVTRAAQVAIWVIEECGEIAGSTAWRNAESILRADDSEGLRLTLADVFFNRPEDFPLGSEVYLRVLGDSSPDGFEKLRELGKHPIARKRRVVAKTLGALRRREGVTTLLTLLEDEDPEVSREALAALGKVGVTAELDPEGKVSAYLEHEELPKRVWAAQALCMGGDRTHEKFLLGLVKEEPRMLTDMGELGDVLVDLGLIHATPFLIGRLKHEKPEFRADAAESLEKLLGVELDYAGLDNPKDRREAVKVCTRWWQDYKKAKKRGE